MPRWSVGDVERVAAFWARVVVRGEDQCWTWTGQCTPKGYGALFWVSRTRGAHVVSYLLRRGDVPPGIFVLHTCDNPPCVNPNHLYLGSHLDNMRDKVRKGRQYRPVGEKNPQCLYDDVLVKAVLDDARATGATSVALSAKYGPSPRTIRQWLNNGVTRTVRLHHGAENSRREAAS